MMTSFTLALASRPTPRYCVLWRRKAALKTCQRQTLLKLTTWGLLSQARRLIPDSACKTPCSSCGHLFLQLSLASKTCCSRNLWLQPSTHARDRRYSPPVCCCWWSAFCRPAFKEHSSIGIWSPQRVQVLYHYQFLWAAPQSLLSTWSYDSDSLLVGTLLLLRVPKFLLLLWIFPFLFRCYSCMENEISPNFPLLSS